MIKWLKPEGTEVETNEEEATVKMAEHLGWKRVEPPKKRGRPKKDEQQSDN